MNQPPNITPEEVAKRLKAYTERPKRAWLSRVVSLALLVGLFAAFDVSCSCAPARWTGRQFPRFSCEPRYTGAP